MPYENQIDTHQARLGGIENRAAANQARGVAQMAAERLSQYGPEGQQWAQRLMSDTRAALAMAKEYGGFATIEQQLRNAAAAGQSEGAQRLDPVGLETFRSQGSAGLNQLSASRKADAEVKREERLLGMNFPELMSYYEATDPSKAKTLAELKGVGGLSEEDVRGLANRRAKIETSFDELFRAARAANTGDPSMPEWGQALTILYNKVLQPNSAVLQGEAEATARSLMSLFEELGMVKEGVFNARSPLNIDGRKRILGLINDLTKTAFSDYANRHQKWQTLNESMGIRGARDIYSRPGAEMLEDNRTFVEGLTGYSSPERKTERGPMSRPKIRAFRNKTTGEVVRGYVDEKGVKRRESGEPF